MPPLPALRDEELAILFTTLPLSQLSACAAVCTQWARVVHTDGFLWSNLFERDMAGRVSAASALRAYRRCVSACRVKLRLVAQASSRERLSPRAGAAAATLGPYVILSGGATTNFRFTAHVDLWDARSRQTLAAAIVPMRQRMPERWQQSAVSRTLRLFEPTVGVGRFGFGVGNTHPAIHPVLLSLHLG